MIGRLICSKSRLLAFILMIAFGFFLGVGTAQDARAQTQWQPNGSNITFTGGNVGIGITNPAATLHVVTSTAPGFFFDGYGTDALFRFRFANGSASNPGQVTLGQELGKIGFAGYVGGTSPGFTAGASASIHAVSTEAYTGATGTGQGAYLAFWTTPTGSPGGGGQIERLRIDQNGFVGIGTTSPARPLHITGPDGHVSTFPTIGAKDWLVIENSTNANIALVGGPGTSGSVTALKFFQSGGTGEDGQVGYNHQGQFIYFNTNGAFERMRLDGMGNLGIGTTSPVAPLHVSGVNNQGLRIGGGASARATLVSSDNATNLWNLDNSGGTLRIFREDYNANGAGANGAVRIAVTDSGSVGIGTVSPAAKLDVSGTANVSGNATVGGSLTVSGNIAAKYQDVAEWVPASSSLPAGTVVTLDPSRSNLVIPSSMPYDTAVAGVVSANPGLALGDGGAGKVLVATTGRVKVKVDASAAPIRVGDLLVTSDKPGIAMKSEPLNVGGARIHRPGTLIGKALEPLDNGQGEILVLLSLQ